MTPAAPIIKSAIIVIKILYFDKTMRTGKTLNRLAKLAPAPNATNTAGKAQHTKVDVDANNEKKFAVLSFMTGACFVIKKKSWNTQNLHIHQILAVRENLFLNIRFIYEH